MARHRFEDEQQRIRHRFEDERQGILLTIRMAVTAAALAVARPFRRQRALRELRHYRELASFWASKTCPHSAGYATDTADRWEAQYIALGGDPTMTTESRSNDVTS